MIRAFSSIILVVIFFLGPFHAVAQTREDAEKRVANLPADERVFERFRIWLGGQPVNARGSGGASSPQRDDLMTRYRAYLREGGFSDSDIDGQIQTIGKNSTLLEAARWNRYFASPPPAYNPKPNQFLTEVVKGRKPGRALDVAMGEGRNSLWLAQQGWEVTGFDIADQAIATAQKHAASLGVKITTEVKSIEAFDFGTDRWDLILLSYAGGGELVRQVQSALKPGGIVVVEAFHEDALRKFKIGGSLFSTGELPHLFQELRTLRYEEPIAQPDFAPAPVRVVRYCAEKPAKEVR